MREALMVMHITTVLHWSFVIVYIKENMATVDVCVLPLQTSDVHFFIQYIYIYFKIKYRKENKKKKREKRKKLKKKKRKKKGKK